MDVSPTSTLLINRGTASRPSAESAAGAFATVEVHRHAEPVMDSWAALETAAPCSIYQTRAWLIPWVNTLGSKAGLTPLFVLARARDGRPVALLLLGARRVGPVRVASWLGGKDANVNLALLHPGSEWSAGELHRLVREAAKACGGDAPDCLALPNQPVAWGERANPMTRLRHQPSPSAAFCTVLTDNPETFLAGKLSKAARKKLRKKEARLAALLGPVTHIIARDVAERAMVLDAFIAQKTSRLRTLGIASDFGAPEMRSFIEAAHQEGAIELHALRAGGRIVAVYGGGAQAGRWSGMFNSFDGSEEVARSSPGDLLLMHLVARLCADGIHTLDLGVGEALYKTALCDEAIPLFDGFIALTLRGRLYAILLAARQRAKRVVKQNQRLFRLAKALRTAAARAR